MKIELQLTNEPVLKRTLCTTDERGHWYRKDLPAATGRFQIDDRGAPLSLAVTCPCGCGGVATLMLWTGDRQKLPPARWWFDGDVNAPTLDPSIKLATECRWHGVLVKGVFEES